MSTEENNALPSEIEENPTPAAVDNEADAKPEGDGDTEAEPKSAKAPESGESEAEGEAQKKPNRVPAKERIAELTRQRKEAEKRAEEAEKRLKLYEGPAPKRSDYTDEDQFEADRAKWAAKAARSDEAKAEAESAKTEADNAKAETWNAQRQEALERYEDFDKAINSVPGEVFTQSVADAILESDNAADVAYFLAKNLDRAKAFAAMTPLQQGREIGRIEAEIAPKPRKLSSAPAPVETVTSGRVGSVADPSKMSMAEYVKWRKSQKD